LTGDPYVTDGLRAVIVLSDRSTEATFIEWTPGRGGAVDPGSAAAR
jgi:hypothetical protein